MPRYFRLGPCCPSVYTETRPKSVTCIAQGMMIHKYPYLAPSDIYDILSVCAYVQMQPVDRCISSSGPLVYSRNTGNMQTARCQKVSVTGRNFGLSPRLPCADCFKTVRPHKRRTHHVIRTQTRQHCIQAQLNEGTVESTSNNRRAFLLGIAAVSLLSASDAR